MRGAAGERLAADYYRKKGYQVIGTGYRSRFGEIDLIVKNRKYIVFSEVKLRASDTWVRPGAYVDERKQRRILTTARLWLEQNETELQPRFDVVEILTDPDGRHSQISVLENAFGDDN